MPADYSIIATFKIVKAVPQSIWNLWKIIDGNKKQEIGLSFNNNSQTVNLFYSTPDKTLLFQKHSNHEQLFDGKWHKLAVSVTNGNAKMGLDCIDVSDASVVEEILPRKNKITSLVST